MVSTPTLRIFLDISENLWLNVVIALSVAFRILRTVVMIFSYSAASFVMLMAPIPIAAAPIMLGNGKPAAYITSAIPNNPLAPFPKPRATLLLPFLGT